MSLITNTFFMKRFFQFAFAMVILSFMVCPANSQTANVSNSANNVAAKTKAKAVTFTEKERKYALKRYEQTANLFIKEISVLSEEQLNFKEDGKRWSIAEVAEHIIVAENAVLNLITKRVLNAPVPVGKDDYRIKDQVVWMTVTNRNTKFNAPGTVQPKGKFKTKAEILGAFKKARKNTMDFVKNTDIDLRNRFAQNPVLGMIDGYQWFLFLNAHSYRHLTQIKQIKKHPDFPAKAK